jgi:hypothetical protein
MILVALAMAVATVPDPTAGGSANDMVLVCYVRDSNLVTAAGAPSAEPVGPHKLVVVQFPSLVNGSVEGGRARLHDPNSTFEGRSIKEIELMEGRVAIATQGDGSETLSMVVEKADPGDSIRKAFVGTMKGTNMAKMLVGHCTKDPLHNANRAFRNWQSKPATVNP